MKSIGSTTTATTSLAIAGGSRSDRTRSIAVRNLAASFAVILSLVVPGVARAQVGGPQNTQFSAPTKSTAAWTSATSNNTDLTVTVTNLSKVIVTLHATSTMTAGGINFEVDDGSGTWFSIPATRSAGASTVGTSDTTVTLSVVAQAWEIDVAGWTSFRVRLNPVISGSGTATVTVLPTASPTEPTAVVSQATPANLQMTVGAALPAGANLIGMSPVVATATTTDSLLECVIVSAASTNSNNCKGSAGNFYGYEIFNTTTTVYYLRLYNLATAPTASSGTGFIRSIPIPPAAAAGQVGGAVALSAIGVGYGTGIGYVITAGSSSTDNTNAATGVFGVIKYK